MMIARWAVRSGQCVKGAPCRNPFAEACACSDVLGNCQEELSQIRQRGRRELARRKRAAMICAFTAWSKGCSLVPQPQASMVQKSMETTFFRRAAATIVLLASFCSGTNGAEQERVVSFRQAPGELHIQVSGQPVASYLYTDKVIRRPFFANFRAMDGSPITRPYPPRSGSVDHSDQHPGIWFAIADINGTDFWRNKGAVKHEKFIRPPEGNTGYGSFEVLNAFFAPGTSKPLCRQRARYTLVVDKGTMLLSCEFQLEPSGVLLTIGDQEEMGFGVRLSDQLSVKQGGQIIDDQGRRNEREIWGKQPHWCDYGKRMNNKYVGVLVMADPENFRPSWFHVRDYGLIVANPFASHAFTQKSTGPVTVKPGTPLRLGFAALIYATEERIEGNAAYRRYVSERSRARQAATP